jgi:hypothetical protein
MKSAALALLVLAALGVGCSNNPSSPSSGTTSTGSTIAPFFFAGTLAPRSSAFYSFNLTDAGVIDVTVVSLTSAPLIPTPNAIVGIGFGTPAGTTCGLTASASTGVGLVSQLTAAAGVGTFCVSIFDVGALTTSTNFVLRVTHP